MTLVGQSAVLLELTQGTNITAREKNPASAQSKKPKPISSMETCFYISLHGLLLLKKTAVSGTPGWWHWNYTDTHTKINLEQNQLKTVCEIRLKHMVGTGGEAFTLLCTQLWSQVLAKNVHLCQHCNLWSLYSSSSLLRSWLYKLSLFSRHSSISFNLFKWHISRF